MIIQERGALRAEISQISTNSTNKKDLIDLNQFIKFFAKGD